MRIPESGSKESEYMGNTCNRSRLPLRREIEKKERRQCWMLKVARGRGLPQFLWYG